MDRYKYLKYLFKLKKTSTQFIKPELFFQFNMFNYEFELKNCIYFFKVDYKLAI